MKFEKISEMHFINLDDFDRSQEVKRVYVNDSGRLLLQDQAWTMDWSLEHKRKVAANLKSDDYIAYTEREINDLLLDWHTFADPATLRRELYDYHFIDRSRDGKVYRLATVQPTQEELGL